MNENIPGIQLLKFNHAGAMLLKDGTTINYGVIRKDDEKVVYYTSKGLQEIWRPDMNQEDKARAEMLKNIYKGPNGEENLIESGHIAIVYLHDIEQVIF